MEFNSRNYIFCKNGIGKLIISMEIKQNHWLSKYNNLGLKPQAIEKYIPIFFQYFQK